MAEKKKTIRKTAWILVALVATGGLFLSLWLEISGRWSSIWNWFLEAYRKLAPKF